jgi:hypothetical protein
MATVQSFIADGLFTGQNRSSWRSSWNWRRKPKGRAAKFETNRSSTWAWAAEDARCFRIFGRPRFN